MPSLQKPSTERLLALLESWKDVPLSYQAHLLEKGGHGFIADEHAVRLGDGEEVWRAACEGLDTWRMFPAWAEVAHQAAKGQEPGRIVAMVARIGGLWWVNPCRVLHRCDSPTTHGFVYGTLPEHAECGEEMFCIEKRADGSVWYVIRAFSRPRHWMAWIGFVLARWWQCRFVRDSQVRMKEVAA